MFSIIFLILLEITYNTYKEFYFKDFLMDIILLLLEVIKLIISKSSKILIEEYIKMKCFKIINYIKQNKKYMKQNYTNAKMNTKKIYYNINIIEAYKYKLKAEKYKDDKTIKFGTILVENDKVEEAIDFIKSERKEERKQENIKYIFISLVFIVVVIGLLFVICLIIEVTT